MSNGKNICNTCKYADDIRNDVDVVGGIKIWCQYKDEWVSKYLISEAEWCSDWENTSSSYSEPNPFEKIFSGIGFGILIILQVIALPVLILTFLPHPILSIAKAVRVIISAIVLFFMGMIAILFDPLMLIIWIVSFGFINTSKLVVIGYAENLYEWITNYGDFWDLD